MYLACDENYSSILCVDHLRLSCFSRTVIKVESLSTDWRGRSCLQGLFWGFMSISGSVAQTIYKTADVFVCALMLNSSPLYLAVAATHLE